MTFIVSYNIPELISYLLSNQSDWLLSNDTTKYFLDIFGSQKGSKFGNLRANLVEFLVLKGNLLVGTQCHN